MSYDPRAIIKLGLEFKKNKNPQALGNVTGTVVQVSPIKISILDDQAYFTEGDNLVVSNTAKGYTETVNITMDGPTKQATIRHNGLKTGDKVSCQFTNNNQKLILLYKIGSD